MKEFRWMFLVILVLAGCQRDISAQFCTEMKHANDLDDVSFYMDGGVCIMEQEDYNHVYVLSCERGFEIGNVIMKDVNERADIEIPRYCEFKKVK